MIKEIEIINNFLRDFGLSLENQDYIFIKNSNYEYIYCNTIYKKFLKKMFGIKSEEIIGKTDFDIYPLNYAKECKKSDMETMKKGSFLGREIIENQEYIIVKLEIRKNQLPKGGIITLAKLEKKGENNTD